MIKVQILITTLFSLVAAIAGALIVHLLTRSREHEAWIRNCKKEEFREVMSALSASYVMVLNIYARDFAVIDEEDQRRLYNAKADAVRVMQDRIYIAKDLPLQEMANSWLGALRLYERSRQPERLHTHYQEIRDSIIRAANENGIKSMLQKFKFWER